MTSFDKINRRAHLYLGLFLMPWLLMYGASSFIVIHRSWFSSDKPREVLWEKTYSRALNTQGANNSPELRVAALEILKDCDLEGAFWVHKPNNETLHIDRFSFRDTIRLTWSIKEQKLEAERQPAGWSEVPVRMHFRGGYLQPGFWNKFWGVLVDVACAGIVIWVVSGLIMWWRLPRLRAWGAVAAGGGIVSFILLVWKL
jgi:hypothetical protein